MREALMEKTVASELVTSITRKALRERAYLSAAFFALFRRQIILIAMTAHEDRRMIKKSVFVYQLR